MKKPDGGPAFPRPASEYTKDGSCADGNHAISAQTGMTLRDYFAAHAPITFQDACDAIGEDGYSYKEAFTRLARMRMAYADAMLAEREK